MPEAKAAGYLRQWRFVLILAVFGGAVFAYPHFYYSTPTAREKYTYVFFSNDDGKTYYVGDIFQIPPISQGSKTVVRAHVFSYEDGSHAFVGYLGRYNSEWKHRLEEAVENAKNRYGTEGIPTIVYDSHQSGGTEVKRPGEGNDWVPLLSPEGQRVIHLANSAGKTATQVYPP